MSSTAHAGALLLDEERSGWEKEIDVDRLNMGHSCYCVLGQLHGNYWKGLEQLGIARHERAEELRLGFRASPRRFLQIRDPWNLLTKAWKQEIADRLQAA